MKKINYFYILFSLLIISALGYQGCSEIKDNLVTAPQIGIHPSGWTDTTSGSFHGKYIFNNKAWNLNECKTCHGSDYRGGNTGASCYDCHRRIRRTIELPFMSWRNFRSIIRQRR
ncbi:MAG: hypothetical protein IPH77_12395 [Ignavibacteria bacterium]|nr:hypothetical protein [Ignavibacteria bacterium]